MCDALATVPKVAPQMVAATLRTIFAQPDLATAQDAVERICRLFDKRYPKLVEVLGQAETDILAYYGFPVEHRRQIWSTAARRRYFSTESMSKLYEPSQEEVVQALLELQSA